MKILQYILKYPNTYENLQPIHSPTSYFVNKSMWLFYFKKIRNGQYWPAEVWPDKHISDGVSSGP